MDKKIKHLTYDDKGVNVEGVVLGLEEKRQVNLRTGEQAYVCNVLVGDDTGEVKLVLWNNDINRVKVGDRVKVSSGYITLFRGVLQLNVGKFGKLEVL